MFLESFGGEPRCLPTWLEHSMFNHFHAFPPRYPRFPSIQEKFEEHDEADTTSLLRFIGKMPGGAHLDQRGHLRGEALGRRQALRAAAHECRGCAQASRPLPELYVGLGGQTALISIKKELKLAQKRVQNKTNEDLELDLELELDVGACGSRMRRSQLRLGRTAMPWCASRRRRYEI